jgi:ELWxxDGT repeat protein
VKAIDAVHLTSVNGTLFFAGDDGSGSGVELWKSNGTLAGTVEVKDINSGPGSSSPYGLTRVGSTLFFAADNGSVGAELWKSDGTPTGTTLVKDIAPGSDQSFPLPAGLPMLVEANGRLLFAADNGSTGQELWKSDGTPAGTIIIKDINGATDSAISGFYQEMIDLNGTLFFVASAGFRNGAVELWRSDGTAAGTTMVKDINPTGSSNPHELISVNGTLYFVADDGVHGEELWKSDGTAAGTTMVKDINPNDFGPTGSRTAQLTDVNGTLFFRADAFDTKGNELWKSDGTSAGTVMVTDIYSGTAGSRPDNLTNVNGTLFFSALTVSGEELWKSDGTPAGTRMVKDINSGPNDPELNWLTNVNGMLFFGATDGSAGYELWKSNGTAAGTVMVKDINSGPSHSFPTNLTNANGVLLFTADDGNHGNELWESDGTPAGTKMVKDINPGTGGSFAESLTNAKGLLLFWANDGNTGRELWKSDGTIAGTTLVKDIEPGASGSFAIPDHIVPIGSTGKALLPAYSGLSGLELWVTDGTSQGTQLLQNIAPGAGSSSPDGFTLVGSQIFFRADDNSYGAELWAMPAANTAPRWLVYLPATRR